MAFSAVVSLLITVVLFASNTNGQKAQCENQCGQNYNNRIANTGFTQQQKTMLYNECKSYCVLTKAGCGQKCQAVYYQRRGLFTTPQRGTLYNECNNACNKLSSTTTNTNNVNNNNVNTGTSNTNNNNNNGQKAQCESQCGLNYNKLYQGNPFTQQQKVTLYNECKPMCVLSKPQCDERCTQLYNQRLTAGLYQQAQRVDLYNDCTGVCSKLQTSTNINNNNNNNNVNNNNAANKAQCQSVCQNNYYSKQNHNGYTNQVLVTLYNECEQNCGQSTRAMCSSQCVSQYNTKLASGQFNNNDVVSFYNDCTSACNKLQTATATTTPTTTPAPTTTISSEALQAAKKHCGATCLAAYDQRRKAGIFTQEVRIQMYDECKKNCQTVSTATVVANTAQCNNGCLSQYNTLKEQDLLTQDLRTTLYENCKVQCTKDAANKPIITQQVTNTLQTAADSKATCLTNCGLQAAQLAGTTNIAPVDLLNACTKTCNSITPAPTTATATTAATNGGTATVAPNTQTNSVTQAECEHRCDNQQANLKALGTQDASFLSTVLTKCKSSCLAKAAQSSGVIDEKCKQWSTALRALYAKEEITTFLDTLYNRALAVCKS